MIVKENITLYKCEFCKKKLFVKGAMERHENFCGNNPKNIKACHGCKHLEEIKIDYEYRDEQYGTSARQATAFRCNKLDKMVYPLIVERKKLPQRFPETFANQIPMPSECEFFNNGFNF